MKRFKTLEEFKAESGHEVEGVWYPRVTKIVEVKAKPALYFFYASLPNYAAGEAIKERSAQEGSAVHDAVETILKGETPVVPELVRPAVVAFWRWFKANDLKALKIEEKLVSKKHRYSGTMDALVELNGKLGVLDIKTGTSVYRDYALQTSAYVEALKEDPNMPPLTRWILRLDQARKCVRCGALLRDKGGRPKIRNEKYGCDHEWGPMEGEAELQEFSDFEKDIKAFLACKNLWEWENEEWLGQIKNS